MTTQKLPQTDSIDELARFWDTHDVADFEDQLEEVAEPVFERRSATQGRPASSDAHGSRVTFGLLLVIGMLGVLLGAIGIGMSMEMSLEISNKTASAVALGGAALALFIGANSFSKFRGDRQLAGILLALLGIAILIAGLILLPSRKNAVDRAPNSAGSHQTIKSTKST